MQITPTQTKNTQLPAFIPPVIRDSPLMRQSGYAVYEGVVDDNTRNILLAEALSVSAQAAACDIPVSDAEEVRGGRPARRFLSGPGGPAQEAFYNAPWLLEFLREVTHRSLAPTGVRGTYSYYARPGDYLAVHRDIVTCDVAVITCLSDVSENTGDGGMLCLYPTRLSERLSVIRATPARGALKLHLKPGQTLVMYGGIVPHALLPVADKQVRVVSVLCYHVSQATRSFAGECPP